MSWRLANGCPREKRDFLQLEVLSGHVAPRQRCIALHRAEQPRVGEKQEAGASLAAPVSHEQHNVYESLPLSPATDNPFATVLPNRLPRLCATPDGRVRRPTEASSSHLRLRRLLQQLPVEPVEFDAPVLGDIQLAHSPCAGAAVVVRLDGSDETWQLCSHMNARRIRRSSLAISALHPLSGAPSCHGQAETCRATISENSSQR